jgi:hypothetical protein
VRLRVVVVADQMPGSSVLRKYYIRSSIGGRQMFLSGRAG